MPRSSQSRILQSRRRIGGGSFPNQLIEADPSIVETAKENLEKRKAAPVKIDIASLVKENPKLVAKAEEAKAAKKANAGTLSAKQAGMVAKRKGQAPSAATVQ